MVSNQNVIVGNVCFIRKNRKVLLLCRNREPMKYTWTGVGGKTEFHEEPLESCIREAKEESGLDIKPELAGVLTTINKLGDYKWFLFVYVANDCEGTLKECSEGTLEWVNEEDLYKKDLFGFIKIALPHILRKNRKKMITGKIVHDNQGDVLSCILRENGKILERIE